LAFSFSFSSLTLTFSDFQFPKSFVDCVVMRFSSALSFGLVLLPALQGVSAGPFHKMGGKGGNVKSSVSSKSVALPSSTTPPASANTAKVNAVNNNGGNNNGGNNGGANNQDPQTSQCLDPKVIQSGLDQNGQNPPVAGQVDSLTTTNNFINFCLTSNLPNTNGAQVQAGSCNSVPMGEIPSVDNMVSAKFVSPTNGQTIPANQQFTVQLAVNGMVTGNFVNAEANYFGAPQQLQNGVVLGHSHVVIEALSSSDQTTPTNPKNFAFFKGLNDVAQNGVLSTAVTNGLPAGAYRMCSINTAANHQPVLGPIAQHGSFDDCSYFTADDGANNGGANGGANNGGANGGANGGSGNGTPSSTSSAPPAASSSPVSNAGKKNGGGKKKGGKGGKGGK
jgi:hypothetical protein